MQAHEVANAVASSADGRLALGPGVIVHLPAGQLIPVKVEADVPLATLVAGQNQLRLKRDLYLLLTPQGQIELSPDGQSWASVAEPRAIARLFHTPGRGSFRVGVGAKRGEGVFIEIGVHKPAPAAAPAH